MNTDHIYNPIAHFRSPFSQKFGIPKQSGLVEELQGEIVFTPEFRNADYLRGIETFDYLWLIWEFSANPHGSSSPLVRPPLLGGNERRGVFATRSPFRPNAIGLSSVKLSHIDWHTECGPVIHVCGADLMDGTPILDIKPYLVYADAHPDARSGFVDSNPMQQLTVVIPHEIEALFPSTQLDALKKTLALDPRPHFHSDNTKIYGMPFYGKDIKFRVSHGELQVVGCEPLRSYSEKPYNK